MEKIKHLLRIGEKSQALALLSQVLKDNPNNAEAWWLLSFAIEQRDRQIYALHRILELHPGHTAANRRMAELDPNMATPVPRPPTPPQSKPAALIRQMPASSAMIATSKARLWTAVVGGLLLLTIGSAFALTATLEARASQSQALTDTAVESNPELFAEAPAQDASPSLAEADTISALPAVQTEAPPATQALPQPLFGAPEELPQQEPPVPAADAAVSLATEKEVVEIPLPALDQFAASLSNGNATQRVGVYVENLFSYPISQQPDNDPGWITNNFSEVTEFRIVRQHTGNDGLIAHNYLAGGQFFSLRVGDIVELVLGDGALIEFEIVRIEDYQALSPNSPTSDFISLDTGDKLSASDLFYRVYGGDLRLTFQTCINRNNLSTWGRTFVIGEEL